VPQRLAHLPFRGSIAIADGLLTPAGLRSATWRRLFRDVYIHVDATVDHLMLCTAAALLLPSGGALSHRSAAALYGFRTLARDQPVEITTPVTMRTRPGLRIVHGPVSAQELWHRGGLPVTSPLRTAFDLARGRDLVDAVVGVDALPYWRAVKLPELRDYLNGHARWKGIESARRAIALARPDVESPMESRVRLRIVLAGLPEPVVQHEVFDRAGRFVARLDLAYPLARLGIEYDGDHHRERATFRHDAVRGNRLELLGWRILRFTADDVRRNPDGMLAQIRIALRR
jgi:hypothetical protein